MRTPNLHTAPKRHLIKIRIFLRKSILIWKNINSQDVLKGLDSTKFLEILHSNKTPNKLSQANLNLFENTLPPPGFETLEFQNCFFYSTS